MATLAAPELDVRPKKPNKLIDNSHPKKEGVKMNLNYNKVMPFLVVMISLINYNVYAGNVTGKNIWLNRYNDETLSEISSGFYADVWGTINEFSSIVFSNVRLGFCMEPIPFLFFEKKWICRATGIPKLILNLYP